MFTGIIEAVGIVTAIGDPAASERTGWGFEISQSRTFTIGEAGAVLQNCQVGDRINVSDVCLSIYHFTDDAFEAVVSLAIFRGTTLGKLNVGSKVNLERPVLGNSRFGGHFVRGKIDTIGSIVGIRPGGQSLKLSIAPMDSSVTSCLVQGEFVAVDGCSALVGRSPGTSDRFTIKIPDYRLEKFAFRHNSAGDVVNIEVDMHSKLVSQQIAAHVNDKIAWLVDDHLDAVVDDALDDLLNERISSEVNYRIDFACDELLPKLVKNMRRKVEQQLDL